jgi:hypothetical protein
MIIAEFSVAVDDGDRVIRASLPVLCRIWPQYALASCGGSDVVYTVPGARAWKNGRGL